LISLPEADEISINRLMKGSSTGCAVVTRIKDCFPGSELWSNLVYGRSLA
jgi:hypothetical protein